MSVDQGTYGPLGKAVVTTPTGLADVVSLVDATGAEVDFGGLGGTPGATGPGTAAAAGRVTIASDDAVMAALIAASKASGCVAAIDITPAAAAYGAGDIMGVATSVSFLMADGSAVPTGSLVRVLSASFKIDVTSVPAGQTSYTLQVYGVTPPSARADNAPWTIATGDLAAYKGSISLGTPALIGTVLYVETQYLDKDIKLVTGSAVCFVELVTVGAHTAAAVARNIVLRCTVI